MAEGLSTGELGVELVDMCGLLLLALLSSAAAAWLLLSLLLLTELTTPARTTPGMLYRSSELEVMPLPPPALPLVLTSPPPGSDQLPAMETPAIVPLVDFSRLDRFAAD